MHTPPWELLGAVQGGGMLRYLGILLGAETCCATLGYSRERWHGTRMHMHTPPWELLGAVQCGDMLRYLGTLLGALARTRNARTHSTLGTPGGSVVAETCRHLGMLLGALADRGRDTPGGTGCPQQRCEYTGRLHMQGDTRTGTRCLGNSWVRCGELRNRRCDVGLLQRSAQSEHASASWQNV